MGKYDFDEIRERRGTNSLKYDFAVKRGKPEGILPLWVADMDFPAPKEVTEALVKKAEHGIFGYSEPFDGYFEALSAWAGTHFGWTPEPESVVLTCGVVFAICNFIEALTEKGDGVLINPPVYYPFFEAIADNERKLVTSDLVYSEGRYGIDFEDLEKKIIENDVKLYLLCNPHNPVGRVWSAKELERVLDICERNGVFVVSDEIHADFIYKGHRFNSVAALKKGVKKGYAVCTSPSKTFNLAGLHNANIYIPDPAIRKKFIKVQDKKGYSQSNIMGIVACEAAYRYGEEWHGELLEYLEGNLSFVRGYLNDNIPGIRLVEPEGTYLVWLDCSGLGLSDRELNALIVHKAGLWLDAGNIFGKNGECFERINIACPRKILETALEKLRNALGGASDGQ
ncbi:MAG: pyridoxal phosphate-dependent aminotransferase [Lachnospiraceae bacterium]|nr:pyridoxal phosphate-dependent aminotransferase [Lachnospiraceae bacterium]